MNSRFAGAFFLVLAFFLPLALYIKTLAPTYIPIDSAEFALCMHFWGLCHPPGFPLYIALGKLFTDFFPIGGLIYRANLFSAIFGAGTVFLVYLTLTKLRVRREIALLLALFLAASQTFWEFSIAADVFTFGAFLTVLTFYFVFADLPYLAFFALGLSASHFYISAALWPVLVWYFLSGATNRSHGSYTTKAAFFLLSAGLFASGFFPQVLMYFRMQASPEINWGHAKGIAGFVDYVRRKEFGSIFLIANPVLMFSIFKVFRQFYVYFSSFFANFAIILPIITIATVLWQRMFGNRKVMLLVASYVLLLVVQLVLLSTIDPTEAGNPFQLNKFYLTSFVIWALLVGMALDSLVKKYFEQNSFYVSLLLGFLILVYFTSNLQVNNYSSNYFSQNQVLDSLETLPNNSIAIVLSHVNFFGGLYEQKINGRFNNIDILYFPNEKNRDGEFYEPLLFANKPDQAFVDKVKAGQNLGSAELYILTTVARNLDRPVFLMQGGFEEKFFAYLKPYLAPYGLWWKVDADKSKADANELIAKLANLRNLNVKLADLELKQQKDDLLGYAISYHWTAIYLASLGKYDESLELLRKSFDVASDAKNVQDEIKLIERTKKLDAEFASLRPGLLPDQTLSPADSQEKGLVLDHALLLELGNNLFTLGNFTRCVQVFGAASALLQNDAPIWNNLASCYASLGEVGQARIDYQKALSIDPNLDLAKKGLEALGR